MKRVMMMHAGTEVPGVRGRFGVGMMLLGGLLLAGCEGAVVLPAEEILAEVEEGATRSEVLALLPDGGLEPDGPEQAATIVQGYHADRYFFDGIFVEVLWVHDVSAGYPRDEFRSFLNPVIFRDQVLDGWGWSHFEMRSEEWGIAEREPQSAAAANMRVPGTSPGTAGPPAAEPSAPDDSGEPDDREAGPSA